MEADDQFERAVRQALAAVLARNLTHDAALAQILAASASAAVALPDDGQARSAERARLWCQYLAEGGEGNCHAATRAVSAVHRHEPSKHEAAKRWLRRQRAKKSGHVRKS